MKIQNQKKVVSALDQKRSNCLQKVSAAKQKERVTNWTVCFKNVKKWKFKEKNTNSTKKERLTISRRLK